jgi:hypothetical protein
VSHDCHSQFYSKSTVNAEAFHLKNWHWRHTYCIGIHSGCISANLSFGRRHFKFTHGKLFCEQLSKLISPYGSADIRLQDARHAIVAVRSFKALVLVSWSLWSVTVCWLRRVSFERFTIRSCRWYTDQHSTSRAQNQWFQLTVSFSLTVIGIYDIKSRQILIAVRTRSRICCLWNNRCTCTEQRLIVQIRRWNWSIF